MSKCSVARIRKSKSTYSTLLRPKYCALAAVDSNSDSEIVTTTVRITPVPPRAGCGSYCWWSCGCNLGSRKDQGRTLHKSCEVRKKLPHFTSTAEVLLAYQRNVRPTVPRQKSKLPSDRSRSLS